ncbi:Type I restriction-modification system methyltransferase subunit [Alloiococcus otitis]|uniref:Type I restriction enzyme EcoR124II M protein n=1 Tax=Alloiococcus otitis ATCC 51267 TaxID=883081 RepID=K9EYI5_9LACT|nr:type I restriction enzyme EcoR124II M protein [Alloiococcus otitis ATCC 51267]SUU81096.1 Type I restriction-modification system methyltransferase subunit [Alloiococcus otitis]
MLPSILVFKQSEVNKVADVSKVNGQATQRAELHRRIWAIADDVRGAVDGWDFKQYILGILFYRFISENITEFSTLLARKRMIRSRV